MTADDDWRLTGQEEYLMVVRLERRRFSDESPPRDHADFRRQVLGYGYREGRMAGDREVGDGLRAPELGG